MPTHLGACIIRPALQHLHAKETVLSKWRLIGDSLYTTIKIESVSVSTAPFSTHVLVVRPLNNTPSGTILSSLTNSQFIDVDIMQKTRRRACNSPKLTSDYR